MPSTSDTAASGLRAPAAHKPQLLTVIGESLVDIIMSGPGLPDQGTDVHPGGSPLNVAVGCSRLGVPTALVTTYATADRHGQLIDRHLAANDVTVINAVSDQTSTATARLDASGAASYTFDISWDIERASRAARAAVQGSTHVHAGSIATILPPGNETVHGLLTEARRRATISYDPNCRPGISPDLAAARRQAERFVAVSDIVKASDEDLAWLYPGTAPETAMQRWLALGPAIVVVTRGSQGPLMLSRCASSRTAAEPVSIADTVGAGDSFMSGLITGLNALSLLGASARDRLTNVGQQDLDRLAAYANRVAAITCSRPGADPPWARELQGMAPAAAPTSSARIR